MLPFLYLDILVLRALAGQFLHQMKTHLSVSNGRLTEDKQIRLVKLETPRYRGANRLGGGGARFNSLSMAEAASYQNAMGKWYNSGGSGIKKLLRGSNF